jgi:hypothetical protein
MGLAFKEIHMKTVIFVIASVAALSGCVAVPAYGPPGVYAAPAVSVVVPYGGYYGYRGGYGHRGYR